MAARRGGSLDYFTENFADRFVSVGVVLVATSIVASLCGLKAKRSGRSVGRLVVRIFAVGFALAAFVATTRIDVGSRPSLVWAIGEGGLDQWRSDVDRFPDTIQSVLLVGNVLVYLPVGFCAAIGWWRPVGVSLLVSIAVPALVELLQGFVLRGVGSTDDFILNALGVCGGWLIGAMAVLVAGMADRGSS